MISGENLLVCPRVVFFGNTLARSLEPVQAILDCGSTEALDATSPADTAGAKVPVTATTVESYFTGSGRSASTATFTYANPSRAPSNGGPAT